MKNELKLLLMQKGKQQSVKMINRSILNKSPSKQLAFFSRAERFPIKKRSISQQKEIERESRSHSSCSSARLHKFPTIPRAQRVLYFDQEKQLCLNPSPQAYNIKTEEEIFKITHKGGTIGTRFNSVPHIKEVTPSAVDYQKETIPVKKSFNRSFTFERSQRSLTKILTNQGQDSPGPKYNIQGQVKGKQILPALQVKGILKVRKIKNAANRFKIASIPSHNRFSTLHLQQISNKEDANGEAQKIQRGHSIKKNTGFSTTRRQRLHTLPEKNPGPGAYIFFSQFSGWM